MRKSITNSLITLQHLHIETWFSLPSSRRRPTTLGSQKLEYACAFGIDERIGNDGGESKHYKLSLRRSSHSRSPILVPIESPYTTSY